MKNRVLTAVLISALLVSLEQSSPGQTSSAKDSSHIDNDRPRIVALTPVEPRELTYDGGTVRFLASSEETNGAWALVELKEMPGYKTNLHRHNHTDETFYVLEGVLTVRIRDKISEYSAGSYVLIPRGTPHAQGNRGRVPVKILLTMTPGGFENSFKDRVELFKTSKPGDLDFRKKRRENALKGNYDVEFLADWNLAN